MKDEWTESYSLILPLLGLAVAVAGLSLSLLQMRSQAVGSRAPLGRVDVDVPRVRYSDGDVYIEVRNPGEWLPMTGFVRPDDPWVRQIVRQII